MTSERDKVLARLIESGFEEKRLKGKHLSTLKTMLSNVIRKKKKVTAKKGTKKKVIKKQKPRVHIKDINFQYDVSYDYDTLYSCEESGCDGICRCGRLTNVRITDVDCLDVGDEIIKKAFPDFEKHMLFQYCVNRIVAMKIYDHDIWEINVGGGYYGQEVYSVKMDRNTAQSVQRACDSVAEACLKAYFSDAIEEVLGFEYGFILDILKDKDWHIEKVDLKTINAENTGQMRKVDAKTVERYRKESYRDPYYKKLPVGVCVRWDDGSLRLFDGYHRYSAAVQDKAKTVWCLIGE